MENEEKFSDNPEEQLRIENELLKLKLQAELGAQFGGNMSNIPPQVEQDFLQQIIAFQEYQKNAPMVIFREYLESPELPLSDKLSKEDLETAWDGIEYLLAEHYMQVRFPEEGLPLAEKYDFVVRDLFPLSIMQPGRESGWIFDYEEFYPNHVKIMGRRTEEFMKDFFENNMDPGVWYLTKEIINAQSQTVMDSHGLIAKINRFHELFNDIKKYEYHIEETRIDDPKNPGDLTLGFVDGVVRYTVEREDGEEQEITGPFKLYFQKTGEDWWEIFNFHLHGFSWE